MNIKKKKTLFEMVQELRAAIDAETGEIVIGAEEYLNLYENAEQKIKAWGLYLQEEQENIEQMIEYAKEKRRALDASIAAMEARLKKSEKKLISLMHAAGIEKANGVCIQKTPHKVEIIDEKLVPEQFKRTYTPPPEVKIDKKLIIERYKTDGYIPPGVEIVQDEYIKVR